MLKHICYLLLFIPFFLRAQYPAQPSNYITDEAGVMSAEQQNELNTKLRAFEDSSSNQIFVYITASLNGADLQSLSQEIFHNWKIGKEGKNNGVLIAVFVDDRKFRIQTGYGMEGVLPDLLTKRIQDEYMRPYFKEKDYYSGINAGIDQLIYYSKHEYKPEETAVNSEEAWPAWMSWVLGYAFNFIFLVLYIRNVLRPKKLSKKQKKKKQTGNVAKVIFITIAIILALFPCVGAIILFFMFIATSNINFSSGGSYSGSTYDSSSSWSSSDSSSSWSSSDSSSSFDGGGGGDSGGGGSSSDW